MKKSTLLAVLVFAGLLVAALMSLQRKPERGVSRISYAGVDIAKVDKVVVKGPKPVTLVKKAETWQLESGKEADANVVKRMLEAIPKIVSSHTLTRDSARYAELEVDEEKGTAVQVFAGGQKLADFVVGKSGSGATPVRVEDDVYGVPGVGSHLFSKDASAWQERKLFKAKLDEVDRVEVELAAGPAYALVKQESDWALAEGATVPEGFRFDKNAARSLASALVNARADAILDSDPGAETSGLAEGADLLRFSGKDGLSGELRLGKAREDKKVHAQVAGSADVVTLAEYTVKNLRKAATDLRELTLIELDKTLVRALEIRDGKKLLRFEKKGADWSVAKSSEAVPDGFELDSAAVDRKLGALAGVRAMKLAAEVSARHAGLAKPKVMVTAILEDKSKVSLAFGDSFKDGERDVSYARGNIDAAIYVVTKYVRDAQTGGLDSFKKRPQAPGGMPNLDPAALSNLPPDVRRQLMQQLQQQQHQSAAMQKLQAQMDQKAAAAKAAGLTE